MNNKTVELASKIDLICAGYKQSEVYNALRTLFSKWIINSFKETNHNPELIIEFISKELKENVEFNLRKQN